MMADTGFFDLPTTELENFVLAFGLVLARPVVMMTVLPIFTRAALPGLMRTAIAGALAFPVLPLVYPALHREEWSVLTLVLLIGKEACIGLALGLALGVPFWALEVAGDLIDAQRGATQGRLANPGGFEDVSITGTLLIVSGTTVFVATGGLETVADLLYRSWVVWRPLSTFPQLDARTPALFLGFIDRMTYQGLMLALPLIVALLVAETGLMVMARLIPQFRIDDFALAVRNVVFHAVLPLYAVFLIGFVGQDLRGLPGLLDILREVVPSRAAP